MKICDKCKKEKPSLDGLKDEFKLYGLSEICDTCLKEINDIIWEIRLRHAKVRDEEEINAFKTWANSAVERSKRWWQI